MDEAMEALILLKEQGKIKNIGVSNFNSELLDKSLSLAPIISNQVPYSMVNRDIEKDLVPFCINNKLSILAYSPLQRGLLTGKYKPHHPFSDGDHRPNTKFFTEVNIIKTNSFLEQIKPIAENHNASISQLILAWTLRRPGITIALVGARNKHQVLENVKSMELKLSNEDIFFLDDELQKLKLVL